MMIQNIWHIHHNPDEWQKADEYIPERFDPRDAMYLRPDGKPRNPMSFIPFSGGKRICLGKTFAETAFKFVLPMII